MKMLEEFRNLMETEPIVFGCIVGFCIGVFFSFVIDVVLIMCGNQTKRINEQRKNALDLIGAYVSYQIGGAKFEGIVASIDFDMDFETEDLEVSVYIDVDGLDEYVKANYKDFNKTLILKGGD